MSQDGGVHPDLSGNETPGAPARALPLWADTVRSAASLPGLGSVNVGYAGDGRLILSVSTNTDSVTFSTGKPEEVMLPGHFQSALAYYSPVGKLTRARYIAEHWTAAQPGFTQSQARISVLPSGAVQIVGEFAGAGRFGAGDPRELLVQTQRTGSGPVTDAFVSMFDAQGAIDWLGRGEGMIGTSTPNSAVFGITTHQDASMTSVGLFEDSMDFSGGDGSRVTIPHGSSYNGAMFVVRHEKSGKIDWARKVNNAFPSNISGRPEGAFLVTGTLTYGTGATFGEGEPAETKLPLTGKGLTLYYVASYLPDGKLRWVSGIEGKQVNPWLSAAIPSGGYLVVGDVAGDVTFPLAPGAPAVVGADAQKDIMLARYEEDGTLRWVKILGGPGPQIPTALTAREGRFYLAVAITSAGAQITTSKGVRTAPPAPASGGTLLLSLNEDGIISEVYALGDGITTTSLAVSNSGAVAAGGLFGTNEAMALGADLGVGSANPIVLAPAPSGQRNAFVASFQL